MPACQGNEGSRVFLSPCNQSLSNPQIRPKTAQPQPQANIYAANRTFTSFKRIVRELSAPCPLVSLHSTSKGFVGECGRRGGYMEVVNFPPEIHEQVGRS